MRPPMVLVCPRWLRTLGLAMAAGLVAAGCGGAAATPPPTAPAIVTPVPLPTPIPTKGPAAAALSVTGDPAAAGLTDNMQVQCDMPAFGGSQIVLYRQNTAQGLAFRIVLTPGQVSVRYAYGAGKTYLERDFVGTGVSGFDAATGATIDSSLADAPPPPATSSASTPPASPAATPTPAVVLGALASIKGSVDCGNQTAGSSTMTLNGTTALGQLTDVTLNPVRVECDTSVAYGPSVLVDGMATVGTTPTLFIIAGRAAQFSVAEEPQTGGVGFFVGKVAGSVTLSAGGVHISGTAALQSPPKGVAPTTITVAGDATCGSTVANP